MAAFFSLKSRGRFLLLLLAAVSAAGTSVSADDTQQQESPARESEGPQHISPPTFPFVPPVLPSSFDRTPEQEKRLPSRSYNEAFAVCGDGVNDPGEECDDGNQNSGDGCSDLCTLEDRASCGNMNRDPGETCDDGNLRDGDGCSATCQTESICGDTIRDPGEQCDDGNTVSGDGCSTKCLLENPPDEKKEDSANDRDDKDSKSLTKDDPEKEGEIENLNTDETPGVTPEDEKPDPKDSVPSLCGNGYLNSPEECDDGNASDGDGCSASCMLEKGAEKNTQYMKRRAETSPSGCLAECTVAVEYENGKEIKRYEVAGERKVTGGGTVYSNRCKQTVSCLTGLAVDNQEQYCVDQPVVVNCPLG